MSNEQFTQRVRDKLGQEVNPQYVQHLLESKSPAELLRWLQVSLADHDRTFAEATVVADSDWQENPDLKSLLDLGLHIIENQIKLSAFILEELRSRVNAVE